MGKELIIQDWVKPNKPKRLPVVFTVKEVAALLDHLTDPYLTMAQLMYGAGLRVIEVLRLRIKDVDFDRNEIIVRQVKGAKDRVTMLPKVAKAGLKHALERSIALHEVALKEGITHVDMPYALAKKYPNAGKQKAW